MPEAKPSGFPAQPRRRCGRGRRPRSMGRLRARRIGARGPRRRRQWRVRPRRFGRRAPAGRSVGAVLGNAQLEWPLLGDAADGRGRTPAGNGHEFAPAHHLEAWLALTEPRGSTAPDLERLRTRFRLKSPWTGGSGSGENRARRAALVGSARPRIGRSRPIGRDGGPCRGSPPVHNAAVHGGSSGAGPGLAALQACRSSP